MHVCVCVSALGNKLQFLVTEIMSKDITGINIFTSIHFMGTYLTQKYTRITYTTKQN